MWWGDLGSGAQWISRGLTNQQFQDEDATQLAAGSLLTQITSIDGLTGIWRSGSDARDWVILDGPVDFASRQQRNAAAGLQMVSLSVGFV